MTDDCKDQLRSQVRGIVERLESPQDVNEDGQPVDELGWIWDKDAEVYRDEDGDECEHREMTGSDFLNDALDVEFIVSQKREYLGARVLVTFGGPSIRVDTRAGVVVGDWWRDHFSMTFRDEIGLDDALEEWWENPCAGPVVVRQGA